MENKEELLKRVKQYIDRAGDTEPEDIDEQQEKEGKEKLDGILNGASGEGALQMISEIRSFEQEGDIESRKLYNFCLGRFCLGGNAAAASANCSVRNASGASEQDSLVFLCRDGNYEGSVEEDKRYIDEDELKKLYRFVKERKSDKTFGSAVFEIMKKHKVDAPQVYKEAMLSRQDFSRVTGPKCKGIKKTTVWSLIIGLHCDMDEANYLLYSAGISKRATVFDLILEYMIITKNYDIMAINEVLYEYDQPLLACHIDNNGKD